MNPLQATGWAQLAWIFGLGIGLNLLMRALLAAREQRLKAHKHGPNAEQGGARGVAADLHQHTTDREAQRDE